jgi:MFS family permease
LIGGWISVGTGNWRWIYWVLFIFLGFIFAFTLFAPETYAPILLKKKAARLRKEHNTNAYQSALEMHRVPLSTTLKIAVSLLAPYPRLD